MDRTKEKIKFIHTNFIYLKMEKDQQIFDIIEREHQRQLHGIELIASENFACCYGCNGQCPYKQICRGL